MTCNFTSFSTVFKSYQDDWQVIMKGCVQWNCIYHRKDLHLRGGGEGGGLALTKTARSVGQALPGLLVRCDNELNTIEAEKAKSVVSLCAL